MEIETKDFLNRRQEEENYERALQLEEEKKN